MKSKIFGSLVVGLLISTLPAAAKAATISGTWGFSAGSYSGSFSFSGLDTDSSYIDSVAAGFSVNTNFPTPVSGNLFTYNATYDRLFIGGAPQGADSIQYDPLLDDWTIAIYSFSTNPTFHTFVYGPVGGPNTRIDIGSVTAAVPEPGSLALLGLGLVGLGLSRRRKAH